MRLVIFGFVLNPCYNALGFELAFYPTQVRNLYSFQNHVIRPFVGIEDDLPERLGPKVREAAWANLSCPNFAEEDFQGTLYG